MRDRLSTIGIENVHKINEKLSSQVMVVRVIEKLDNVVNQFVIED